MERTRRRVKSCLIIRFRCGGAAECRTYSAPPGSYQVRTMYETFEHTADLGLRVRSRDLDTLFADAARGLYSMIAPDVNSIRPTSQVTFELGAESLELLLFDWLSELLYTYETRHLLFSEFDVTVTDCRLTATARGEPIDPARHELDHEVKAITYHGLKLERQPDGQWLAEVIVDI